MSKNSQRNSNLFLVFAALLVLSLLVYIGFRLHASGKRLIPVSVVAIIAGVIFEGRRLSDKWSGILITALIAFGFSFFSFLPGKGEHNYNFESHIEIWPYSFIVLFSIGSIVFLGDKVVPKLTEGITLLQSIAVVYWVIDYGFIGSTSVFLKSLMIIGLLFSLYTAFHAFTHTTLTRTSRLIMSVWSSVIMMLFAVDNVFRVYQNEQIENTANLTQGIYVALQFFLLGVSSIYIIQNAIMLIGFLPGKGSFFNAEYFRDLSELKDDHINRYSDKQVHIFHSFVCLLFTGAIFTFNYHYQILPRHLAIWVVFVVFPFLLIILNFFSGRRY